MSNLKSSIQQLFEVGSSDLPQLIDQFVSEKLAKGDFLVSAGRPMSTLGYIQEGYLRVYQEKDGKDVTQWISGPGDFITDLQALVFRQPARWNIQALTDVTMMAVSGERYANLSTLIPEWERLEKIFIAKCFLTLESRIFSFLSMTAEERFKLFFELRPELFNEVPLHYIASMLGMTPETLSRIRAKFLTS